MNDDNRQTGRTTRQIVGAPQGATFVWPHAASISCPRRIAEQNGRLDLNIICEAEFRENLARSGKIVDVVIDHATRLSDEGFRALVCVENLTGRNRNGRKRRG